MVAQHGALYRRVWKLRRTGRDPDIFDIGERKHVKHAFEIYQKVVALEQFVDRSNDFGGVIGR